MANRAKTWDENISKRLKNKSYRQKFFISLIEEEGLNIREAIYTLSKTMGNQEFAKLIKMAPSNTSRVTNPKNAIKDSTLTQIIKRIGCELTVKTV